MYEIYNPFEKAFKPDPDTGNQVKILQALVPTGSHVGHANDLKVVRNRRGGGGRATRLEHYRRGRVRKAWQEDQRSIAPRYMQGVGGLSMAGGLGMVAAGAARRNPQLASSGVTAAGSGVLPAALGTRWQQDRERLRGRKNRKKKVTE